MLERFRASVSRLFTGKALTITRAAFVPVDNTGNTVQFYGDTYPTKNYGPAIKDGRASNVIMAPIQWIMRTFPEAEPVVERKLGDKPWAVQPDHPLADLLENPNPWYDGACLFQATALSYLMDGNAYWLKLRTVMGGVAEYWYVPHWMIEPKTLPGDPRALYYEYTPDEGQPIPLDPSEVVHFRFGIDPENPRKGLSQLKTLMREAFTDEEAAAFTTTILRNHGVPGILVSPKSDTAQATDEDTKELKRYLKTSHTGDRRGEPLVMNSPTDIQQFGFDPNQLTLANLRDISEERVCAALGLPAAVVGFGAGLQSTKVGATMREMRRLAWVSAVIPMQIAFGRQLTKQTLPDFEAVKRWRVRFDTSGVSAFQEEETEKAARFVNLVSGSIITVADAQEALGFAVDESQRVYLRANGMTAIKEGDPGLGQLGQPAAAPGEEPPKKSAAEPDAEDESPDAKHARIMAEASALLEKRRALPATNGHGRAA